MPRCAHRENELPFLEVSPYEADRGELIGRDPREMDVELLRELGVKSTPIKAIKDRCTDCVETRVDRLRCELTDCPLWVMRLGKNAHRIAKSNGAQGVAYMDAKGGVDPRTIAPEILEKLGHPLSPAKALRAHCVDCCRGSESEVRKCTAIGCKLWPYRMGTSPFRPKSDAEAPLED